jgi:hypothetical protein
LTYEEIGKPIDEGTTKTAYTLKNHPDLLFLQLNENLHNLYLTGDKGCRISDEKLHNLYLTGDKGCRTSEI